MYDCKIIADSISSVTGTRLTTMEVTFPRIVLAEFNTHRMFSRNSASSRAIPVEKQIKKLQEDPFYPVEWGKNQKGMQAKELLDSVAQLDAIKYWEIAQTFAIAGAKKLHEIGVHKQIVNRLLEPFMWHTVIVTATEWDNFFALRCHPDAQPEIRKIARMMEQSWLANTDCSIRTLEPGEWHLPYVTDDELIMDNPRGQFNSYWIKVSAGRCARVSYLTHDGKRDPQADIDLCDRLIASGHMSPLEHPATPMSYRDMEDGYGCSVFDFSGNFRHWKQYRKTIPGEDVFNAKNIK